MDKYQKIIFSGLALCLFWSLGFMVYGIYTFNNTYQVKVQSPVVIRTPIWLEKRDSHFEVYAQPHQVPQDQRLTPTPILDEVGYIQTKKHAKILIGIYTLESSRGRNDSCKLEGKYNGYGYGQNSTSWNCFESFEIVTDKVNNWVVSRLAEGYSVPELLCYYNRGIRTSDCPYYQKYLEI